MGWARRRHPRAPGRAPRRGGMRPAKNQRISAPGIRLRVVARRNEATSSYYIRPLCFGKMQNSVSAPSNASRTGRRAAERPLARWGEALDPSGAQRLIAAPRFAGTWRLRARRDHAEIDPGDAAANGGTGIFAARHTSYISVTSGIFGRRPRSRQNRQKSPRTHRNARPCSSETAGFERR